MFEAFVLRGSRVEIWVGRYRARKNTEKKENHVEMSREERPEQLLGGGKKEEQSGFSYVVFLLY